VTEGDFKGGPDDSFHGLSESAKLLALGQSLASPICGGKSQQFVRSTGAISTIHVHRGRDAFELRGEIRDKWYELGAESSILGCPAGEEQTCSDGRGRFSEFVTASAAHAGHRASGIIVCRADGVAHEIHGAIWRKWVEKGSVTDIGYPVSDEFRCDDGVGRFNQFFGARRARIYLTPSGGVHIVGDPIYAAWVEAGLEAGALGYPVSDEEFGAGFRVVRFEHGEIWWSAEAGIQFVHPPQV
jgi:uncharacterized protein with LGFP repeats